MQSIQPDEKYCVIFGYKNVFDENTVQTRLFETLESIVQLEIKNFFVGIDGRFDKS